MDQSTSNGISTSLISIIIPLYNKFDYIETTLQSVINQTLKGIEVIIVDDGSTDGSAKVCQAYAKRYDFISYIFQENQGVALARNTGIAHTRSNLIFPLDADDELAPNCLEKLYEEIQRPGVDVAYCLVSRSKEHKTAIQQPLVNLPEMLISNCVPVSALHQKTDWEKYNGYNSNMQKGLEDWDYWLNFVEDKKQFSRIEEILFYYRKTDNSRTSHIDRKAIRELYSQIIKNHSSLYQKYSGKPLHFIAYKLFSLLRFIPFFKKMRNQFKIYNHVAKYKKG